MSAVHVFALDDIEYWAGETLEQCLEEARRQAGPNCYDDPDLHSQLGDKAMAELQFIDDDDSKRSFADELARRVAAGESFPQLFAAEDW